MSDGFCECGHSTAAHHAGGCYGVAGTPRESCDCKRERTYSRAEVEALLVAQREACVEAADAWDNGFDKRSCVVDVVRTTPLVEVKP